MRGLRKSCLCSQARLDSSVVEHQLGKLGVVSSILTLGSELNGGQASDKIPALWQKEIGKLLP